MMDETERQIWLDYWNSLTPEEQTEASFDLVQIEMDCKAELKAQAKVIDELSAKIEAGAQRIHLLKQMLTE